MRSTRAGPGSQVAPFERRGTTGVILGVLVGHPAFYSEIWRAPDSGGSPDTGADEVCALLPPGPPRILYQFLPADEATRWFRGRHKKNGWTTGAWTPWTAGVPVNLQGQSPQLPAYPTVQITQAQPRGSPGNVEVGIKPGPEHSDIIIRYAYLALGTDVPPQSLDATDWSYYSLLLRISSASGTFTLGESLTFSPSGATATLQASDSTAWMQISALSGWPEIGDTITGGTSTETATLDSPDIMTLARDDALVKKLAAWADLNTIWGPVSIVEVTQNLEAQITASADGQIGDGEVAGEPARVYREFTVDQETVAVRIYRRRATSDGNFYPTVDGTISGEIDPSYYRGEVRAEDAWRFESGGYSGRFVSTDWVYDIAVAIDRNGNPGVNSSTDRARWEYKYDVLDLSASSNPLLLSCERTEGQVGTSCTPGNQQQASLAWTVNGDVSDVTEECQIFLRQDLGIWIWQKTVSAEDGLSGDIDLACFKDKDPPDTRYIDCDLRVELKKKASPWTVYSSFNKYDPTSFEVMPCIIQE